MLSAAGALVEVFALDSSDELRALAAAQSADQLIIRQRKWPPRDLAGAAVAVGAFDYDAAAGVLGARRALAGIAVNVVDCRR